MTRRVGKERLVEMTAGVKPLTIIGSLDYMITFSDPVIRKYLRA